MSKLHDYFELKKAMSRIKEIEKNPSKDKKYWTTHQRDYSTNFGTIYISYYAGDYGSSSVSNQLPKISDDTRQLFSKFIDSKLSELMNDFLSFMKNEVQKEIDDELVKVDKRKNELLMLKTSEES